MYASSPIRMNADKVGTYGNENLYYVDPGVYEISISDSWCYQLKVISIDGKKVASYPGGRDYDIDLNNYCDGKIHQIRIAWTKEWPGDYYSSEESVCYFINTSNLAEGIIESDNIFYKLNDNKNEINVVGSKTDIEYANIKNFLQIDGISYPVKKISLFAFYKRNSLKTFYSGDNLQIIDDSAFKECSNLCSVILGTSVENIHTNAFSQLYKVFWLSNTPPIGHNSVNAYMHYASSSSYPENFIVYDYLSSMFEVEGVKYVPVSPSDRTCIAVDCIYENSPEIINITETVTNKGIDLKIIGINAYSFYKNTSVKTLTINNSVDIPKYTFSFCNSINKVDLKVRNIGYEAFIGCGSITEANIETSEIDENAFQYSALLDPAQFNIKALHIGKNAFKGCAAIVKAEIEANEIGESAFQNCSQLEPAEYNIIADSIGMNAFNGCSSIVKAEVNANHISEGAFQHASQNEAAQYFIKSNTLEKNAFSGCSAIVNVEIEANEIGEGAFQDCSQKEPATYKITADKIGYNAFNGCASLTNADINCKVISQSAFKYSFKNFPATVSLKNVEEIGNQAFFSASAIGYMELNDEIKKIGTQAFYGCNSLETITIPNSVIQIGSSCFKDCRSLNKIDFGSGISTLASSLLANCKSLSNVTIPTNINTIENGVFSGCVALEKVIITDRIKTLELGINGTNNPLFSDCPLKEIYIGGDIVYKTDRDSGYSPFYSNTFLEKVEINNRETEISDYEFYGCSNLKSISMGNGVRRIGKYAFSGCSSLESFSFGTGMKTIEQEAFSDCTALTSLISHALVPPTCGTQALDDINKWECQLTVPEQAVNEYKNAAQWKEFFFINGEDFDDDYTIYPSKIVINTPQVTLNQNETLQLTAIVEPDDAYDKTITWSSKDESVATVSADGIVKGISAGKTEIIATCGDIYDTCEVTVIEKQVGSVDGISTDEEGLASIYTPEGILVKDKATLDMIKDLESGIYIIVTESGKTYKIVK